MVNGGGKRSNKYVQGKKQANLKLNMLISFTTKKASPLTYVYILQGVATFVGPPVVGENKKTSNI